MKLYTKLGIGIIGLALLMTGQMTIAADNGATTGTVYVMSNKAHNNSVLVFERAADGSLTLVQESFTQGAGTGVTLDPLMSQGALSLCARRKVLLAVNPASGDLTAFRVTPSGLVFGSKAPSGGAFPVSVTCKGGLVYVLNQLGVPNISGFKVSDSGQLQPISLSTRDLAGGPLALPAQVSFTPDGTQLLVTEKGTNIIDVFTVRPDGRTDGPIVEASSGKTPFGFAFGPSESVVVSEVENRLPLRGTVSSYQLAGSAGLESVSPRIPNRQSGACWVAVTGTTAWVVNTGTATISAYQIGAGGNLLLVDPDAAFTGDGTSPIDLEASENGQFLYVLKSATGEIAAYHISGTSLTPLFTQGGLPLSIQGIAVQ
jgi:6-phosphogluconolactonase (cycloisomerase 2 family)